MHFHVSVDRVAALLCTRFCSVSSWAILFVYFGTLELFCGMYGSWFFPSSYSPLRIAEGLTSHSPFRRDVLNKETIDCFYASDACVNPERF